MEHKTYSFGDWPLPEPYLQELGRLGLLWARLETFVCNSVANLAGVQNLEEPRWYVIFTSRSFDENLQLLARLCEQQLEALPNLAPYPDVVAGLKQAQTAKVFYLNGSMRPSAYGDAVEISRVVNELTGELVHEIVQVSDISKAVLMVDQAQHDLYKLICAMERPSRIIA